MIKWYEGGTPSLFEAPTLEAGQGLVQWRRGMNSANLAGRATYTGLS